MNKAAFIQNGLFLENKKGKQRQKHRHREKTRWP